MTSYASVKNHNQGEIFFLILVLFITQRTTEEKYKEMAVRIKSLVDDKTKYTDWDCRDDIKAELKMDLILLLAEYGYPPSSYEDTYNEIFEQTENFKKYNED